MLKLSRQVDYGKAAPDFALPDTEGKVHALNHFAGAPALLVAFICNHCPFVLHIIDELASLAREYQDKGLSVVAISSNDSEEFPEDGPEFMADFAREHALPFPYLYDGTQDTALAFGAICTPDFFLYDRDRKLAYCGQFDSSRPSLPHPPLKGTELHRRDLPVTGEDMRRAVNSVLQGKPVPQEEQQPSAGCSINWRPGKDPSWG